MKKSVSAVGLEWWLWWRDRSFSRPAFRFRAATPYVDDGSATLTSSCSVLELALRREGYDSSSFASVVGPRPLQAFGLRLRDRRKGRAWVPAEITPPLYRVASCGPGLYLWVSPEVLHATGKIFKGALSPAVGWRIVVDLASPPPESPISPEARVAIDHLLETGRVLPGVEGALVDTVRKGG